MNDAFLFLVGAGLGVGLGILLAPKSGRETREAIRDGIAEGQDYLARQSRVVERDVSRKASHLAGQASDFVEKGKEAIEGYGSSVAAAVDAGREAYRSTVSDKART
ncbi:MAG: YtxH domain-containing protein [Bryobacteraceae bacterium]|nr:YtxH domain-containing protein [Bryobacteraceae bacterium]